MTTTTAKRPQTTKTCDRCGATGLTWRKSTKTGRYYLAEPCVRYGYTGKPFKSMRLHKCLTYTPPAHNPGFKSRVWGHPATVIENPETHEHDWHPWQKSQGSTVRGGYCFGCGSIFID